MKIIVTGGRASTDEDAVFDWLDQLLEFSGLEASWAEGDLEVLTIVQGGARGVDKFAREWCMKRGVNFKNYPYLSQYGKAGGALRNRQMAVMERPDFVVAFPGGLGTRSMMSIAHELKIPVIIAGLTMEN